ncbi:hypothetical protein ACRALDRAFT_1064375 [Sodiomyces alcalophilus JCM 7366]|uniref:uncharacterized protein n=1 Tax=Sodiomyces alcalophilus JCM 7366 TaxID=591952 RepID=UPI0039B444D1
MAAPCPDPYPPLKSHDRFHLLESVKRHYSRFGYNVTTLKTRQRPNGEYYRVDLACDRGGRYKPSSRGIRVTRTTKTGCTWSGSLLLTGVEWLHIPGHNTHNHPPPIQVEDPTKKKADAVRKKVEERTRIRDLLPTLYLGSWATGPKNSLTDVPGVLVATETVQPNRSVNTGATIILPRRTWFTEACYAGFHRFNGGGELTGAQWLAESGLLNSPIVLTNSLAVGDAHRAVYEYAIRNYCVESGELDVFMVPVVAEIFDGYLSDITKMSVEAQDVTRGIDLATDDPVKEGNTGGGTGAVCHHWKGGTGSASRVIPAPPRQRQRSTSEEDGDEENAEEENEERSYTVGVLVQANYGKASHLRIAGVPIGRIFDQQHQQRAQLLREQQQIQQQHEERLRKQQEEEQQRQREQEERARQQAVQISSDESEEDEEEEEEEDEDEQTSAQNQHQHSGHGTAQHQYQQPQAQQPRRQLPQHGQQSAAQQALQLSQHFQQQQHHHQQRYQPYPPLHQPMPQPFVGINPSPLSQPPPPPPQHQHQAFHPQPQPQPQQMPSPQQHFAGVSPGPQTQATSAGTASTASAAQAPHTYHHNFRLVPVSLADVTAQAEAQARAQEHARSQTKAARAAAEAQALSQAQAEAEAKLEARMYDHLQRQAEMAVRKEYRDGSVNVVIATDAPLSPLQCQRLAKRASVGIARTGGYGHDPAGDLFLAFSTGNKVPVQKLSSTGPPAVDPYMPRTHELEVVDDATMNGLFEAAADATEEAVYNALCMAEPMEGFRGRRMEALPLKRLKEMMQRYL